MKKPYLYAFVAIAIWSTTATVSKLLLHSFTTIQILAVCSAMAAVFLFAVNLFSGKLRVLKTYRLRDYLITAGVGLLGTFFYNMFLVFGIGRLLASQAMIINYLWPMMIVLFSCLILKERVTVLKCVAMGSPHSLFLWIYYIINGDNWQEKPAFPSRLFITALFPNPLPGSR